MSALAEDVVIPIRAKALLQEQIHALRATGRLPSPKGVALELLRALQKEDVQIHGIVTLVQSDPALAGRLIQAANACSMGVRRPVASVRDAVLLVGLPALRQLALGFSLIEQHGTGHCRAFRYGLYWAHSLATGVVMERLADRVRVLPPEEAFALGLLGQVGCLALATLYPRRYGEVLQQLHPANAQGLAERERSLLAITSGDLSVALLGDWGFPSVHISALEWLTARTGNADLPANRAGRLARMLAVARHLAWLLIGVDENLPVLEREQVARVQDLEVLGLDPEAWSSLLQEGARQFTVWSGLLGVAVPDISDLPQQLEPEPAMASERTGLPLETPASGVVVAAEPSPPLAEASRFEARVMLFEPVALRVQAISRILSRDFAQISAVDSASLLQAQLLAQAPELLVIGPGVTVDESLLAQIKLLRQTELGRQLQILWIAASLDSAALTHAFEAGIDDFVELALTAVVLPVRLRAARRQIEIHRAQRAELDEMRRLTGELVITNQRLQEAALTDPLTGLGNRRVAFDRIDQEMSAARRRHRPVSVLMIDIDHFKQVNDQHGHDVGDAVLRQTAQALRETLRTPDTLCRIGGEEFLAICPDSSESEAWQCAERLRRGIAAAPVVLPGGQSLTVTVSIGVATIHPDIVCAQDLVKEADLAVYRAKAAGRNRVAGRRDESRANGTA